MDVILGALGALASRGEIRGTQKPSNPSATGPKRFFSARAVDWCLPRAFFRGMLEKPRKTHHSNLHVPQGLWGPLPPRGEIRGTQKAPNPSAIGPKRFFWSRAVDWCPPRPGHPKPIARDI